MPELLVVTRRSGVFAAPETFFQELMKICSREGKSLFGKARSAEGGLPYT